MIVAVDALALCRGLGWLWKMASGHAEPSEGARRGASCAQFVHMCNQDTQGVGASFKDELELGLGLGWGFG